VATGSCASCGDQYQADESSCFAISSASGITAVLLLSSFQRTGNHWADIEFDALTAARSGVSFAGGDSTILEAITGVMIIGV
jgi:ribose/xylose/arabinose/galactoside ABC-type transport system permease subunit